MLNYEQLDVLPQDFQDEWQASLEKATPTEKGVFRLVNIRRTEPRSFEEQRIIVLVIDENGFPLPNVNVAFSFSTAKQYALTGSFLWSPPAPQQAFIVPTQGGGQIDQVQGSAVKEGEPGGITVYILEPEFSSDIVRGMGMLPDHTGVHLTFQLQRTGVLPLNERLAALESRMETLEAQMGLSSMGPH